MILRAPYYWPAHDAVTEGGDRRKHTCRLWGIVVLVLRHQEFFWSKLAYVAAEERYDIAIQAAGRKAHQMTRFVTYGDESLRDAGRPSSSRFTLFRRVGVGKAAHQGGGRTSRRINGQKRAIDRYAGLMAIGDFACMSLQVFRATLKRRRGVA